MSRTRSVGEIRNLLQGLIFDCPMGTVQPDCVIGRVRELEPLERLAWVKGLSDTECLRFFLDHRDCLLRCEGRRETAGED